MLLQFFIRGSRSTVWAFVVGSNFAAIAEVNSTELAIPLPITVLARAVMANSPWVVAAQCYQHGSALEKKILLNALIFCTFPPVAVLDAH